MPAKERGKASNVEAIRKAFQERGYEFVRRNILYMNQHSTGNYGGYLASSLRNDYGKVIEEDEDARKQAEADRKALAEVEAERQRSEEEKFLQAEAYYERLPSSEQQKIREDFLKANPMIRNLGATSIRTMVIHSLCDPHRAPTGCMERLWIPACGLPK